MGTLEHSAAGSRVPKCRSKRTAYGLRTHGADEQWSAASRRHGSPALRRQLYLRVLERAIANLVHGGEGTLPFNRAFERAVLPCKSSDATGPLSSLPRQLGYLV